MLLLIASAWWLAGPAAAQQLPDADPPGRVARLAESSGQVWLYSPETGDWIGATRNRPLTTGDRLATDAGARAELQIGSTTVRLDGSSELEVTQLDDDHVVLQLQGGSAIARVRDLTGAGQLELGTEEGRFLALRAGSYRFDRAGARSSVTVYSGQARYEGPNSGLAVNPGQRAEFWIDAAGLAQYSTMTPVGDAFVAWSDDRDRRFVGSIAERYVSPEMTGAAELDAYGRWEQNPDYGSVWIPTTVAAGWAPYSQGHWAFVRPWGWTWVDDAPWGFAPFHYGRWVYARNNWCWTPGTRVARPVYAPALVAWVGGPRANVSVGVGGPAVGWFPLAPREVYVPSYRVSPRYARNVNITNVTNVTVINNVFANPQGPREFENRHSPRAITVVPANVMAERRPVGPAAAQYAAQNGQAPWMRDFANERGRTNTAMVAPPVATPPLRGGELRGVRPPPGTRPDSVARPGGIPRDRAEAELQRDRADRDVRGERDVRSDRADRDGRSDRPDRDGRDERDRRSASPAQAGSRDGERGGFAPGQRPPGVPFGNPPAAAVSSQPVQPSLPMQSPIQAAPPQQSAPNATLPNVGGMPPTLGGRPLQPSERGFGRFDSTPPGGPGRTPREREASELQGRPPAALPAPGVLPNRPAITTAPPQEMPTMRALPMQRIEERRDDRREERRDDGRRDDARRDERRFDERRLQPRPDMPVQPSIEQQRPPQAPRFERPVMPAPAQMPARPAEAAAPVRPAEMQRVAPPAAPPPAAVRIEAPRPDQQRSDQPRQQRGGGDQR